MKPLNLASHALHQQMVALTALLTILALGGCGSTTGPCPPAGCLATQDINITDRRTFIPSIKLGIDLDETNHAPSEPHTGRAIEFGLTGARGSSSQSIQSGQQILNNDVQFAGPQELKNKFDFYQADISYRWRKFFWERTLGLEMLGGVGFSSLDLTVSSPSQSASKHFSSTEGQGGIGLIYRLDPETSLQARVGLLFSGDNVGIEDMRRYELSYAKALDKNFTLRAGFSSWQINGRENGIYGSPLFKLRFSGPTVILDWDFNGSNSRIQKQAEPEPSETLHTPIVAAPVVSENGLKDQVPSADQKNSLVLAAPAIDEKNSSGQPHLAPEPQDHIPSSEVAAAPAIAATKGFLVSAGVGMANFSNSPVSSNPDGGSVRIDGGYNLNRYAGVEVGYSTGKATASHNGGFYNDTNTLKYSAVHVAAIATYPYTDKFGVFAKLGLAKTTLTHTHTSTYGNGSGSGKQTNAMFGLGWNLNLNRHFGIRAQYENFGKIPMVVDYGGVNYDIGVQLVSVSGVYNF